MFGTWPGRFVITAIIGALAGGILFFTQPSAPPPPPPPTSGLASAWVAPVGTPAGSCSHNPTPQAYNAATSCSTFTAAVAALNAGERALVSCGDYPAQTIGGTAKSSAVTIEAATHDSPVNWFGALTQTSCVHVATLSIDIDKIHVIGIQATPTPWTARTDVNLEFQDIQNCTNNAANTVCSNPTSAGALFVCIIITTCNNYTDVLIDGWKGPGGQIQASGVTIDHSNFGGFDYCYLGSAQNYAHVTAMSGNGNAQSPFLQGDVMHITWAHFANQTLHDTVINHSVFHDNVHGVNDSDALGCNNPAGGVFGSSNGSHSDQIQGNGCSANCVVKNSAFWDGGDKPIQWTAFNGAQFKGIKIENNYFGSGYNTSSAMGDTVAGDCDLTIANNVLQTMPNLQQDCSVGAPVDFRNNIILGTTTTCALGNYGDTMDVASIIGDGSIHVASLIGFRVGQTMAIGPTYATAEKRLIQSITPDAPTAPNGPGTITFTTTLSAAHASGTSVNTYVNITYSHIIVPAGSTVASCNNLPSGVAVPTKRCTPTFNNLDNSNNMLRTVAPDPTLAPTDTCGQDYSDAVFPATDFIGTSRPQGIAADAGAAETKPPIAFVSLSGNDSGPSCKPYVDTTTYAAAIAANGGAGCATLQGAYQKVTMGGTVEIQGGNGYPNQVISRGTQSQTGPDYITFRPAAGATVGMGSVTMGLNNGGLSGWAPNFLHFTGGQGVWNLCSIGMTQVERTSLPQPQGYIIEKLHLSYTNNTCGHLINISGVKDVQILNNDIGPNCCGGNGANDGIVLGVNQLFDFSTTPPTLIEQGPNPTNVLIQGNTIHDLYDSCTHMSASALAAVGGSCTSLGYGDNGIGDHTDCLQSFGASGYLTIKNNTCIALNPTSATTTGAAQGLFMESANGGTYPGDVSIIGNILACGCGSNILSIANSGAGQWSGSYRAINNTVQGNMTFAGTVPAPTFTMLLANNFFKLATGCSMTSTTSTTITPTFSHNFWGGNPSCPGMGTDTKNFPFTTANLQSINYYTPDFHQASISSALNSAGDPAYCPATDIDNEPRLATCAVGADEFPGSKAVCTPSPCTPPAGFSTSPYGYQTISTTSDDGAGKIIAQTYKIWRPAGLTNSSTNLVPAVVHNGCASDGTDWMKYEAVQQRFIMVCLVNGFNPTSWDLPYTTEPAADPNCAGIPNASCGFSHNCGPASNQLCNDAPYVAKVMSEIFPGGVQDQNLDVNKVFNYGSSNAGQASTNWMCDPTTSSYFSGFDSDSIQFRARPPRNFPICAGATTHNFSWTMTYHTTDPAGMVGCPSMKTTPTTPITDTNCEPGMVTGCCGLWFAGPHTGTTDLATLLNCNISNVVTQNPSAGYRFEIYSCPNGKKIRLVKANASGHAYGLVGGVAGRGDVPNVNSSQLPGVDYFDRLWQFWITGN